MYWTDDHAIRRANTDGSGISAIVAWDPQALGGPFDIEIDVPGNAVPATSFWGAGLLILLLAGAATAFLRRRMHATSDTEH